MVTGAVLLAVLLGVGFALWAWRISGGLAVAVALVVQVVLANPVFETANVGRLPVANGLFLAYALPAAMAALAHRWIDVEPNRNVALVVEAAASILAFVYVSLEVRHLFDPAFERRGLAELTQAQIDRIVGAMADAGGRRKPYIFAFQLLLAAGFFLFMMTLVVNVIANLIVNKTGRLQK